MRCIWKCNQCETGPCYVCGTNAVTEDPYAGESSFPPHTCPFSPYYEDPEWKFVSVKNPKHSPYHTLMEWFGDEGYDKASPALRDAIISCWFDGNGDRMDNASWAIGLLNELEAVGQTHYGDVVEMEEMLKKIPKKTLLYNVWARAFQCGLMLAEKIRVELEERQKNHKPPFDKSDY